MASMPPPTWWHIGESDVLGLLLWVFGEEKQMFMKTLRDIWALTARFMAPYCCRVLVILKLSSVILPSSNICVPLVKFDYFPCSLSQ